MQELSDNALAAVADTHFDGRPAYKLGERTWLDARAAAEHRHGSRFDLKAFHTAVLSHGSMGLDPLVDLLATL